MPHFFQSDDGIIVFLGFLWWFTYLAYTNLRSNTRAGLVFGIGFAIIAVLFLVLVVISLFNLH